MKGLTQESRVRLTGVLHPCVPALFNDRRDSGIGLNLDGTRKAVTLCSQSSDQARDQGFAGPGKRFEDREIRVGFGELLDALFALRDVLLDRLNEPHRCWTMNMAERITA